MTKHNRENILLLFLLLFLYPVLNAQQYQINFENSTLSDALVKTSEQFKVKVAFDNQNLDKVIINKKITANTIDEFLLYLLVNTGYTFQFKHNNYLIVEGEIQEKPATAYQITGSIIDVETGEQLPFATVRLPDQNYSIPASENGTFYLGHLKSGSTRIVISYIGYYILDTTINMVQNESHCSFKLSRKLQEIEKVVVNEPKVEMVEYRDNVDFATTLNPLKLIDLPVMAETDIFRALQLLPGVSYSENSSELSIRGGTSDQNLVLYDGQTLYNLSHYFGLFSSINPNVIKDIQIFKGGYDSRYGERVSGIVDITGKNGNQLRSTVYGDVNLVSGNIVTEIPLGKKVTLMFAGRRSYSDVYSTEFANNLFRKSNDQLLRDRNSIVSHTTPSFFFFDINSKLNYRISDKENITLGVYGGKDHYTNKINVVNHSLTADISDVNTWNNYGVNATWLKQWNDGYFTSFQVGTSGYSNVYNSKSSISDTAMHQPGRMNNYNIHDNNRLSDISVNFKNSLTLNKNHLLSFGLLGRRNSITYKKDAESIYIYDNKAQTSYSGAVYAQDQVQLGKWTLKPGLRIDYYDGTRQVYFEPRFATSYKFTNAFSVRFATGKFYQFISQVLTQQDAAYNKNFWVLANDSLHPVQSSTHYVIGSTYSFNNFVFDIEFYYKTFAGVQEYTFVSPYSRGADFPKYFPGNGQGMNLFSKEGSMMGGPPKDSAAGTPGYYVTGEGRAYGMDVSLRYKFKNFTSWVSFSLGRSVRQYPWINNNAEVPAPTDQLHQVSWANMFAWQKWNFGSTCLFSTGRPYIDFTQNKENIQFTRIYKRLPNYFRTDVSANYSFNLSKVKFKAGLTLINIFNTQNYYDINSRKFETDNSSFSETNLIRAQELSYNLFLHFSF